MVDINYIKQQLRGGPVAKKPSVIGLSSGSTTLNLACTGRPDIAFLPGKYYFFCGDSDSGKTFLCLTSLAEATLNPAFDDYRLIYDAPEGGALMDMRRFFGDKVADRLEPPAVDSDGNPRHSQTAQEFYFNADDALKKGPCIIILDSQDCLSSDQENKKFTKDKALSRRKRGDPKDEEKAAGSYGDAKAKIHSANLRRLMGPLAKTGSILIIINQTRASFDMFEKESYSGGFALKFYATLQLWSKKGSALERTVRGKKRQLGIYAKVRVKKNRVTGRDRRVVVPIYHSVGIDDVGGCIDYLVEEGVWKDKDGVVTATGLGPDMSMRYEKLIRHIQDNDMEDDVRELVASTWDEIEEACQVERKSRYQ